MASLLNGNYRYQGYPRGNFEHANNITGKDVQEKDNLAKKSSSSQLLSTWFGDSKVDHRKRQQEPLERNPVSPESEAKTALPTNPPPKMVKEKTSTVLNKFHISQSEAEQELMKFKMEKLGRMKEEENEKRKALDMLRNYYPWGKPGAGAPNNSVGVDGSLHRKQKFMEEDLDTSLQNGRKSSMPPDYVEEFGDFHSQFGRPGAGAPLRTESGQLKAEVKNDPLIRFLDTNDGHKMHEVGVRYKKPGQEKLKYQHDLDDQVQRKAMEYQQDQIQELKKELEMLKHDPYGKPGAGAPNKTASGRSLVPDRTQSNFEYFDPWSKGHGQAIQDERGEFRRRRVTENGYHSTEPKSNQIGNYLDIGTGLGGGGAPVKTLSGNNKTRFPITMRKNEVGDPTIRESQPGSRLEGNLSGDPGFDFYDPWGRPGAGAPIRDNDGNNKPTVFGRLQTDQKTITRPRKEEDIHLYNTELDQASKERQHMRELDRLRDMQESKHHQAAMDTFWGRPGAGAPNPRGVKQTDLENSLHLLAKKKKVPTATLR